MLTKTLNFETEVVGVLRGLQWAEDGLSAILTGQLDRKMYERVNKALEAMGGKWNRSAKAHLFQTDPRSQVEGLLETGAITIERDGFFETPETVVRMMLGMAQLKPGDYILEPSAGLGAIAKHFACPQGQPFYVTLIEKNELRAKKLGENHPGVFVLCTDFMAFAPAHRFNKILMNPPFEEGQDIKHVRHAFDLLQMDGTLVTIMGEGAFFKTEHLAVSFREWLKNVGGSGQKLPESSFKESGTGVNARIVVIRK